MVTDTGTPLYLAPPQNSPRSAPRSKWLTVVTVNKHTSYLYDVADDERMTEDYRDKFRHAFQVANISTVSVDSIVGVRLLLQSYMFDSPVPLTAKGASCMGKALGQTNLIPCLS